MLTSTSLNNQISFKLLVECVKDYAIFLIDISGHVIGWNDGAEYMYGYTESEIIGTHFSVFYGINEIEQKIPEMNLQRAGVNGLYETEGWRIKKDGTRFQAKVILSAWKNESGELVGFGNVVRNMTIPKIFNNEGLENIIKERTAELTEALEYERELNEKKSRFLSIASHEFRTPLSTILSSITLIDLYRSQEMPDQQAKHIERIKTTVNNLTIILDEFLSIEKIEKGKIDVQSTVFDLKEFMEEIVDEMDGMINHKQLQLIYEQPLTTLEVCQDKGMLRNVILNLLSNAVKYSPEGKQIRISISYQNEFVTISIKDEGIGIPQNAQNNLFSKFYRALNAANVQGSGLGLNIVKKFIELMNGHVFFSSKENEGSTFTVKFPTNKT